MTSSMAQACSGRPAATSQDQPCAPNQAWRSFSSAVSATARASRRSGRAVDNQTPRQQQLAPVTAARTRSRAPPAEGRVPYHHLPGRSGISRTTAVIPFL